MLFTKSGLRNIIDTFSEVQSKFPENSDRKNYFLATCRHIDKGVNLHYVNVDCLHRTIIGVKSPELEKMFNKYKLISLHAILHDGKGYMKKVYNIGPGYDYICAYPGNSYRIGHLTGYSYCLYLKYFRQSIYESFNC